MLFLAHLRGDPIGLSVGGLAVISKSVFLTVSIQLTNNDDCKQEILVYYIYIDIERLRRGSQA